MNYNAPKWDWLKMIPSWNYSAIVLAGWPGWDKKIDGPDSVTLKFTCGEGKGSREIAVEWDDIAQGQFYYRDYTSDNLPIVHPGDTYESIFVFQLFADADTFRKRYGTI